MTTTIPTALGSVIRSKLTGMTLVRLRAGWVNFNQSVAHQDNQLEGDEDNWTVLYNNGPKAPTLEEQFAALEIGAQFRFTDWTVDDRKPNVKVSDEDFYDPFFRTTRSIAERAGDEDEYSIEKVSA